MPCVTDKERRATNSKIILASCMSIIDMMMEWILWNSMRAWYFISNELINLLSATIPSIATERTLSQFSHLGFDTRGELLWDHSLRRVTFWCYCVVMVGVFPKKADVVPPVLSYCCFSGASCELGWFLVLAVYLARFWDECAPRSATWFRSR